MSCRSRTLSWWPDPRDIRWWLTLRDRPTAGSSPERRRTWRRDAIGDGGQMLRSQWWIMITNNYGSGSPSSSSWSWSWSCIHQLYHHDGWQLSLWYWMMDWNYDKIILILTMDDGWDIPLVAVGLEVLPSLFRSILHPWLPWLIWNPQSDLSSAFSVDPGIQRFPPWLPARLESARIHPCASRRSQPRTWRTRSSSPWESRRSRRSRGSSWRGNVMDAEQQSATCSLMFLVIYIYIYI